MYKLNTLSRNVLIMPDEVINQAQTKHTLDVRMIEPHIIVAEERFIVPALGYNFYEALIAEKNTVVTSSNKATLEEAAGTTLEVDWVVNASESLSPANKALWNRILWKYLAECVMIMAYPEGFVQFGSAGTIHDAPPAGPMNTSGNVTPDLRSLKWAMDKKMLDRINPLAESMHLWLCKQKKADDSLYELYCKKCDCDHDGVPYKRRTDIILDLYDDVGCDENKSKRFTKRFPDCCD